MRKKLMKLDRKKLVANSILPLSMGKVSTHYGRDLSYSKRPIKIYRKNRAQAKNRGKKPRNRHFDSPNGMFFDESAEQNSIP